MKTINLNDKWKFTKINDLKNSTEEFNEAEDVRLPHCWNAEDGQSGEGFYRGQCWYQRKINIGEGDLKKFLFLEIGAAGNVSEVYINGQLAGSSKCGFSMYRVALNSFIKSGDNFIAIMVDNSRHEDVYPLMADFTFYGGLYRDVNLIITEAVHFDLLDNGRDGVYLTQNSIDEKTFELKMNGRVINEAAKSEKAQIKFTLFDMEQKTVLNKTIDIEAENAFDFEISEQISDIICWQGIENPYLYTLKAELICNKEVYDVRDIEIGFRKIEITPDKGVFLNGKPIKLNGVSRHQDFGGVGNAVTKEHMDLDMSLIKEIGANSIRLSHYQHDDYFYKLCDREGMLVWAEIPFISVPTTADEENKNAKEQLEKLIKQAYNHSTIYCWGVQNEITIAVENEKIYEKVRELEAIAKELDSSRFTASANIYSVEDESPLNEITDVLGYNLYYGWYYGQLEDLGDRLDKFHKARPKVPVLVSEYGVDTNPKFHTYDPTVKDYTEEYQMLFHNNAINTINEKPFVLGGYVWNMFDFGSANRNEGGEKGKNQKGFVTIDRKIKKDAFYLYKANWSKVPFVHLAGKRFVNRHEVLNDICVISNLDLIKIFVNGEFIGEIHSKEAIKNFKEVKLSLGANMIRAEGYDNKGIIYEDEMIVNRISELDKNYVYVKVEDKNLVTNWFEKFDLTDVQEVNLKEGYYSTFDTIKELYENEAAKAIFLKYFGHMADSPRMQEMMGVTSIDRMSKISQLNIPKEILPVINKELNEIPKAVV
ncbi:glycoside hydrolase family 2 protein [Clostridium saccharoperbutylacetonicum]